MRIVLEFNAKVILFESNNYLDDSEIIYFKSIFLEQTNYLYCIFILLNFSLNLIRFITFLFINLFGFLVILEYLIKVTNLFLQFKFIFKYKQLIIFCFKILGSLEIINFKLFHFIFIYLILQILENIITKIFVYLVLNLEIDFSFKFYLLRKFCQNFCLYLDY